MHTLVKHTLSLEQKVQHFPWICMLQHLTPDLQDNTRPEEDQLQEELKVLESDNQRLMLEDYA